MSRRLRPGVEITVAPHALGALGGGGMSRASERRTSEIGVAGSSQVLGWDRTRSTHNTLLHHWRHYTPSWAVC